MTEKKQIYKCPICGIITSVLHEGNGILFCCGQPMKLIKENDEDAAIEKHIPVIQKINEGIKVFIGENPHPMGEEHNIEWIEIEFENKVYRKFLKPGESPEAIFEINSEDVVAKAYCNLHGLWRK